MANERNNEIPLSSGENLLRNENMEEIISYRPGFLSRWALFFFLAILIVLLGVTWVIHYPDVIKARGTLTATNAPKEILIRQEGRLIKLFVKNNDVVSENALLGFIESNAKHEQVLVLSTYLDTAVANMQKGNTQNIVELFKNNFDALGELQQVYQQFIIAHQQFSDYLSDGFYLKKKIILTEDLSYLFKNYQILLRQEKLMQKDLILSEESYKVNESLLKDKVISKQDQRNEESKLLNKQLSIPQMELNLLTNETQRREKQNEINELEHRISQQKLIFQQSLQTLQSQVNEWKRKYILQAPASGKIAFLFPVQENQFLKTGRLLGFVNPVDSRFYAEINLSQYNFGKVGIGQNVQLRFDAYPYQEFGYVNGRLQYIADIATDSGFMAHVQLTAGLMTNQHKMLHYRDGLKAEAMIITKDMRLMERFYNNIVTAVKR